MSLSGSCIVGKVGARKKKNMWNLKRDISGSAVSVSIISF